MIQTMQLAGYFLITSIFVNLTCGAYAAAGEYSTPNPRVTIIIDDIGNNLALGILAVQLPGDVTFAIMPHTPNGVRLAEQAHRNGKKIILHAPMQSHDALLNLGKGALLLSMEEQLYRHTLITALESIPHISGLNNHMGSLLTEHRRPMTWLMSELKKRNLYFIDSFTSARSVARQTALRLGLPSLTRDVFLDNDQSIEAIDKEYSKFLRVARRQGYAIAIGHPYPNTLSYLKQAIPKLEKQGINLINASSMISGPNPNNWKKYTANRH